MINYHNNISPHNNVKNFLDAETSEKRVNNLLHAIDESAIVAFTDINGKINYVNDKFCEISGFERFELIGKNHRIINSGYHPKKFFLELWSTIKSGKIWKGEIKNKAKDGSFYWVFTTIVPILNERGRPHEFFSIRFDITDKKRLEEENAKTQTEILKNRINREASERFVSSLTHDLRTPLTVMKISAMRIEKNLTSHEVVLSFASKILQNIHRTEDMITDLLDATKIRAGQKLIVPMDYCDANDIAYKTIDELGLIYGKRFRLSTFGEGKGIWNNKGIKRIIENLCTNAVKYGDKDKTISIELITDDELLKIKVHNWGEVINQNESQNLFEFLQRARSADESNSVGWGIGLTIVKGIAESHGGTVEVSSSLETGTIFKVVLPQVKKV